MAATRSIKNKHREPRQKKNPSMATLPTPSRRRKPRTLATVSAILAVLLVISVVCLLLVSSNTWRAFQQVVSYETISVVNEFPHDPQAFTQVNFFISYFCSFLFFYFCCCSLFDFFNGSSCYFQWSWRSVSSVTVWFGLWLINCLLCVMGIDFVKLLFVKKYLTVDWFTFGRKNDFICSCLILWITITCVSVYAYVTFNKFKNWF